MADDSSAATLLAQTAQPEESRGERLRRLLWPGRLSARLLILTVALVSTVGLLILFPLLANYETRWLRDRLGRAEVSSFAFDAVPDKMVGRPQPGSCGNPPASSG